MHRKYTRQMASVSTPLEVVDSGVGRNCSAWLLSAGGGNSDIITAFDSIVSGEPSQVVTICGKSKSRLVAAASARPSVERLEFDLPGGKDGFLATNSLFAFCLVIAKAYLHTFSGQDADSVWRDIICKLGLRLEELDGWRDSTQLLWDRENTIVLYGPSIRAAAIDIESKFTEAAIGVVQLADFRNFGHGRHVWLAKRGDRTGILSLTTPNDRELAAKTLSLVPSDVPIAEVQFDGCHLLVCLSSIVFAICVAGWAGRERGIDPGRPGVPDFGRKLYHLRMSRKPTRSAREADADMVAIERKCGVSIGELERQHRLRFWRGSLKEFKESLYSAEIRAVVFDYDGTLVETTDRFRPPGVAIQGELVRILGTGTLIGIATGRGDSVKHDLRTVLHPSLWDQVFVGYHNCSYVGRLSEDDHESTPSDPAIEHAALALRQNEELATDYLISQDGQQLALRPRSYVPEDRLWNLVHHVLLDAGIEGLQVLRSSHSVDVLASGVSKLRILEVLASELNCNANAHILKIGDRGQWPGNDFALLSGPLSLSVDEVSPAAETGWHIGPRGYVGTAVTAMYCRSLSSESGHFRWAGLKLP
jgi:hydroxymethylpyrimidine pyrophosphatase-like HAD family hydrolase